MRRATTAGGPGGETAERSDGRGGEITVAIVGNPQMEDISAPDPRAVHRRDRASRSTTRCSRRARCARSSPATSAAAGQQFDVVMIGMYEAPQFGSNGWLLDLTPLRRGRRVLPARRRHPDRAQRAVGRRQAVRGAVLRRVVVPDVPQGRPRRGRPDDARPADVGPGGGDRPRSRQRRDGRHLPARQAGLGRPRRVVHDGAQHVRRHVVVGQRRTAPSARRRSTSPSSRRR